MVPGLEAVSVSLWPLPELISELISMSPLVQARTTTFTTLEPSGQHYHPLIPPEFSCRKKKR